ncbi:hypothetical protein [Rhizobacter fulvus]|jgi:hypothetical protein
MNGFRAVSSLLLASVLSLAACDKLKPPIPSTDMGASAPKAADPGASAVK